MKKARKQSLSSGWMFLTSSLLASSAAMAGIQLAPIGTYDTGVFAEGAAEIVAHDPASQRLFVVNAASQVVDILDISDPTNPTLVDSFDVKPYGKAGQQCIRA